MNIKSVQNFVPMECKVLEITDKRLVNPKELSPVLYYNFRNTITKNQAGIAPSDGKFFLISSSNNTNTLLDSLKKLGVKIQRVIKDPESVKKIIEQENKILRKFL